MLLALLPLALHSSLEVSIDTAVDENIKYSTLYLQADSLFTCKALKDDFDATTQVVCAFDKKPAKQIKKLSNEFFTLKTFVQKETFFISIRPKYKMKLYANVFDLTQDDNVFSAKATLCKRWFIVGYKDKFPLIKKEQRSEIALNFPVYLDEDKLPYVQSLDIKGNPVYIKKVEDVSEYIKVKKYFEKKQYERCLDITEEILQKYPNTLFKAELLYYQIKIYNKLKDFDNVIANSKIFLREFSADENVPEVISLVAYAYGKIGMYSDSDYFFDRLFSEHAENKFAFMGHIYKGELEEESGGNKKAQQEYKQALYGTKDVDVAIAAAFHLGNLMLQMQPDKAAGYFAKIIDVKPSFFIEDLQGSMKLAKTLADRGNYEVAAQIMEVLFAQLNPTYDEYEEVLAYKGLYLAHTKQKKEALAVLNDYLKKFSDGDYLAQVEAAKDQLFFDIEDLNSSVKLAHFDKLLQEYTDESIQSKALYEKAKLLNQMQRYQDVLDMKEQLLGLDEDIYQDVASIIYEAAIGAMQDSLRHKNCENVLLISSDNNVTLSSKWDNGVYECAMKGGDYTLAKQMISRNMGTKVIEQKKLWLYRYIKVNFATGNYQEVIDAAKDLVALIEIDKDSKYRDVYRILFDTYDRLERKDEMLQAMLKIEDVFGDSYEDIDRYADMIAVGIAKKDDNIVIKYGQKLFDMQQRSGSHAQTPYVEFSLYQAYMNQGDYEKALKVISALDDVKLDKEKRARQKYLLGTAYAKLWRDEQAQKAYDDAIAADKESAWAKLAQSAKGF